MEFKEVKKPIEKKKSSTGYVDPMKVAIRVTQMMAGITLLVLLLTGGLLDIAAKIATPIAEWITSEDLDPEEEDTLERWDREEKQREELVAKEFGVTPKDFILTGGDFSDYEVLIDGKYYVVVFDFDYTKIEKLVYKGIDD